MTMFGYILDQLDPSLLKWKRILRYALKVWKLRIRVASKLVIIVYGPLDPHSMTINVLRVRECVKEIENKKNKKT